MQVIAALAIVLVLSAGGYFTYQSLNETKQPAQLSNGQAEADGELESETQLDTVGQLSWELTDLGEDPVSLAPSTKVVLIYGGRTYDLGTHMGSCAEIAGSGWQLVAGETAGVICWFAGGGTELGVFVENGTYVVKQGALDEGSAEIPGMRGAFRTLLTLEVPL